MARSFIVFSIFMLALISPVFANTSTVTAGLEVVCPGKISISTAPAYMKFLNISINYSLQQTANCIIPNATGPFKIISKSNSTAVFSKNVAFYNVSSIATKSLSISSNSLANTTYYAELSLAELSYKMQAFSNAFELVNPANITTSVSASPGTASPSTPILIKVTLYNKGSLASSNIIIDTSISGPQPLNFKYISSPLAPGQGENISYIITNLTSPGLYNVNVYSSYSTTLGHEMLNSTSHAATSFTISSPPPPSPTPTPTPTPLPKQVTKPITTTPSIGITTAPLITSGSQGTIQLSQLGLENTANTTEIVNISVPKQYSSMLSVSANSISVKPGTSISVQLAFSSNSTTSAGTYTIPITLSASINNKTTSTTEYMMFSVYSKSNNVLTNQVLLANNTNTASGIVKIANPGNTTMSNVHVITMLPELIAKNTSYISAYGLSNNITVSNGYYVINWYIPYIPAGQSTYAYYTVSKPQNQALLANIQNIMEVPSAIKPSSLLKVIDINTPTFYSNSTNVISVEELYTGTSSQQVVVQLLAPPGVSINPNFITVNATPNQAMIQKFYVTMGSFTGTEMLNLYISTIGFNATYALPAVVLPLPTTTITTTIAAVKRQAIPSTYYAATATILIIIILLFLGMKYAKRPKYNADRVSELKQIRETIKREE